MRYVLCFPLPSTDSLRKPKETKVLKDNSGGKRATRLPSAIGVSKVAPRPFTMIILILSNGRPRRSSRSSTCDPEVISNSNSWHPSPASFLKFPPKRTVIRIVASICKNNSLARHRSPKPDSPRLCSPRQARDRRERQANRAGIRYSISKGGQRPPAYESIVVRFRSRAPCPVHHPSHQRPHYEGLAALF